MKRSENPDGRPFHVMRSFRQEGWSVRRHFSSRAARVFETEGEAIVHGKLLAKRWETALYVHRTDGSVNFKKNYG